MGLCNINKYVFNCLSSLSSIWYQIRKRIYFFGFFFFCILVDGDRIVFIGRDGVQYPPFHIKDKGGHLLAFLTCLESGLEPNGYLDPPLEYENGQGSVRTFIIILLIRELIFTFFFSRKNITKITSSYRIFADSNIIKYK